jgi:hypothetical protein
MLPLCADGVERATLEQAEHRLGHRLPDDLREFLRVSDGSEWVEFPECSIQILSLKELLSVWELPESDRSGPHRLIDIASDGGRERFCFDPASGHIVMLDITWEDGEPPVCATSLTELVDKLANGWSPFPIDE